MTIGKLSGQCDFGQKGQSYCNQRGQSCVAKRVKVAWLFHAPTFQSKPALCPQKTEKTSGKCTDNSEISLELPNGIKMKFKGTGGCKAALSLLTKLCGTCFA